MKNLTIPALALTSSLALSGCGAGPEESPGATASASPTTPAGTAPATGSAAEISAEHNDADVMFAQMMIPHHEQAVQMSETLLGKDLVPQDVRDLAERVAETQAPEMERMRAMLAAWDAPETPDASAMEHGGHDSGMVDEAGMERLRKSEEGPEAAELYLQQMTEHHEGAVDMAQDQLDQGVNPEAVELAREIVRAQETEIEEMRAMLEELRTS